MYVKQLTLVSSLGCSVVDYCLVHKDEIHKICCEIPSELVSEHNYKESKGIQDHSIFKIEHSFHIIIESVDSICRDGTDTPIILNK